MISPPDMSDGMAGQGDSWETAHRYSWSTTIQALFV
jgi:hypothetical protein